MQHTIKRLRLEKRISSCIKESPVTVLLGARQTGKTTLARLMAEKYGKAEIFDLEEAASRRALENPETALSGLRGLVVIDEVQRLPGLFEVLRPLCDNHPARARFLLLGSASLTLVKGVSESLAGRAIFVKIPGFSLDEIGAENMDRLWLRGAFPRAYLAADTGAAIRWLDGFVSTFLERDLPQMGIKVPAGALRRFWMMLAHYHGQICNFSELARAMDISSNTARSYLDILSGAFMLRMLPPWHENIKKRQIKAPKAYFRDSGLLHLLLGVQTMRQLRSHPRYGAAWEGFALEQILAVCGGEDAYFWSTQRGAELDLLLIRGGKRYGFEFKSSEAPAMTRSMYIALEDLKLDSLRIIYPGTKVYKVHDKVTVVPLGMLSDGKAGSINLNPAQSNFPWRSKGTE
ncbi:MAG: ATP-binding protein [Elusimicrobiota bacterium]